MKATLTVFLLIVVGTRLTRFGHADDSVRAVENSEVSEVKSPADEQLATQRTFLNHLAYRNRRHEVLLRRSAAALRTGNVNDGLAYLQRILDQPQDSQIRRGAEERLVSARREASRILSVLSDDDLMAYERLFGSLARRLLTDARQTGELALFIEVTRRFFHTAPGFQAMDWQATRWLDHGRYRLAARSWRRLLSEPAHRKRITPSLRLKTALAFVLSGQHQHAAATLNQLKGQPVRVGNLSIRPEMWLAQVSAVARQSPASADWRLAFGNEQRNVNATGSPPFVKSLGVAKNHLDKSWTKSLAAGSAPIFEITNWMKRQSNDPLAPMAVANYPIVVGNQVVVRDYRGVSAFSLHSGKTLWRFRSQLSLAKLISIFGKTPRQRRSQLTSLDQVCNEVFVGNSVLGMLSSDGNRVYAVDFFQIEDAKLEGPSSNSIAKSSLRIANRLIALPLVAGDASRMKIRHPIWTAGGIDGYRLDNSLLAGHIFLGPPLPIDGLLFAMTHSNRQVNLVALSAARGKPIWSQCLALLDQPLKNEIHRFQIAETCQPSFSDGILVCPTDAGLLVGVDALTGSLLWSNYCGDESTPQARWRINYRTRKLHGSAGFANLAQIQDRHIVYLPRQSDDLHCIDLITGQTIWKTPREDAEYVAAVTEQTILVIGLTYVRGLSLQSGRQQWSQRFGIPSGRGIRIGNSYLLPLKDGRVVNVDIAIGCEIGFGIAADSSRSHERILPKESNSTHSSRYDDASRRPSNLVAASDMIISLGPQQVAAFPQATTLLAKVTAQDEHSQSTENVLLAAELQVTLGEINAAERLLARVMSGRITPQQRGRAEIAMRAILYYNLRTRVHPDRSVFVRLDKLARLPADRGRYLMHLAEWQLQNDDFDGLLQSTHEFSRLNLKTLLPTVNDSQLLGSPVSWISSVIARAEKRVGKSLLTAIDARIENELQLVRHSDDIDELRHFLAVYSRWPLAASVRMRLAKKLIGRGHFQEAELLLLQNRASDNLHTAATATAMLMRLWDRLGLHTEAAALLGELNGQFSSVRLSDERTGREFVAQFPRHGMTWSSYSRLVAPDWPINRVAVSETRWIDGDQRLKKILQDRHQLISVKGSQVHLLTKHGNSKVAVLDSQSGVIVANIALTSRPYSPTWKRTSFIGHFIPLGTSTTMLGISLVEHQDERPLWNRVFEPLQQHGVRVGPAGPSFCTFQAGCHLMVLHPATGRVLWRRTDLDVKREGNTYGHPELFGDDQVLVVLRSDRSAYTAYRTSTGQELRRGKLDMSIATEKFFGRKVFYVTNSKSDRRMRIWDSLTDEFELDESLATPATNTRMSVFTNVTPEHELSVMLPTGRLRIFDVQSNRVRLDRTFDTKGLNKLSYVRIFSDRDRYFINFRTSSGQMPSIRSQYHMISSFLPLDNVEGEVFAVEKSTGQILWKRSMPRLSVLRIPQYRLPFLIGLSRKRVLDSKNRERQSTVVEVIDAGTGQTLAEKGNLIFDQFVQVKYERDRGRLQLRGLKTQIELNFGGARQRMPVDDEPL